MQLINSHIVSRPLLTIAIPTYNRLDCLILLINSIIHQLPKQGVLGNEIAILICNNCSSDGTTEYLNELESMNGITIVNHSEDIGAVANVIHCCEVIDSRYLWIIGDDDVPLDGAILAVLECLYKENPDLLYLPSFWKVGNLTQDASRRIEKSSVTSLDGMMLAVHASVYVTFISSWIMNIEAYKSYAYPLKLDRYRDTMLPNLEWIFTLMVNGKRFFCADEIWLTARAGSSGGYSVFEAFSLQYNRIVDEKFSDNSQLHRFFRRNMLWCFIPGLVWGMRKNTIGSFGDFDKGKTMSLLKSAYGNDLFFLLIVVPMIFLMKPLALSFWFVARLLAKLRMKYWRVISSCK